MSRGNDDEHDQEDWLGRSDDAAHPSHRTSTAYTAEAGYEGRHIRPDAHRLAEGLHPWYQPGDVLSTSYADNPVYPWPSSYISGAASGEDLANLVGYGSGSGTDNDSTSALEDLLLREQIAHFPAPFDPSYPFQSISGGQLPDSSSALAAGGGGGVVPQTIPTVGPAFVLTSSSHASSSPARASPPPSGPAVVSTEPSGPAEQSLPSESTSARGKKRVRESSPSDEVHLAPARADVKRPKAAPRPKKTKTASSSSGEPQREAAASPDSEISLPRKAVAPKATSDSVELAAASARRAGRKGPLPIGAREKPDEGRSSGACWRCRRYKKPCNNRSGTCDTCLTSGFRIWPASLGCRRGDIQEFVYAILPNHMEEVLETLPPDLPRPRTWRQSLEPRIAGPPSPSDGREADKWDQLCQKVLGTRLFGQEFAELFEILAQYQRDAPKEDAIFNLAAAGLSYQVDLYHLYLNLDTATQPQHAGGGAQGQHSASETVRALRASLANMVSTWLSLCLRGRMPDFPIAFLGATMTMCGLLIFSDSVAAMRQLTGQLVWQVDARAQMTVLRTELMAIALDLLGVVAKGAKPLRFSCWQRVGADGERSAEGMRLMGGDVHAFEAMASLQRWIRRWRSVLDHDTWYEAPPFTPGIRPICALARFARMGHGDFDD